jgi:hypothetical protein
VVSQERILSNPGWTTVYPAKKVGKRMSNNKFQKCKTFFKRILPLCLMTVFFFSYPFSSASTQAYFFDTQTSEPPITLTIKSPPVPQYTKIKEPAEPGNISEDPEEEQANTNAPDNPDNEDAGFDNNNQQPNTEDQDKNSEDEKSAEPHTGN